MDQWNEMGQEVSSLGFVRALVFYFFISNLLFKIMIVKVDSLKFAF